MWELDDKEGWMSKHWCFWTVVLEKTLESPLDCKIKIVNPKGNQPCLFTGRTDAQAQAPVLWPLDAKNWLEETLMLGKTEAAGEGDNRGWDAASLTQWTWFWASSGSWWWTGKPGVLHSMGLQRVRHDWATELTEMFIIFLSVCSPTTMMAFVGSTQASWQYKCNRPRHSLWKCTLGTSLGRWFCPSYSWRGTFKSLMQRSSNKTQAWSLLPCSPALTCVGLNKTLLSNQV